MGTILRFTTGKDEEPFLGFDLNPSIRFVESDDSNSFAFIPTSSTYNYMNDRFNINDWYFAIFFSLILRLQIKKTVENEFL